MEGLAERAERMRYLLLIPLLFLIPTSGWGQQRFGYDGAWDDTIAYSATGRAQAGIVVAYTWTAETNDSVHWIMSRYGSNGGDDSMGAAIYEVSGGKPTNRVGSVYRLPVTTSFPTLAWDSVETAIELTNGTVYCVAMGEVEGSGTKVVYVSTKDVTSGDVKNRGIITNPHLLAATWGFLAGNVAKVPSLYAVTNRAEEEEEASGPPNVRHSPEGAGVRHSPDGSSSRHEP